MTSRPKSILFSIFTFSVCLYILINPYQAAYYSKFALSMCANSVVPSLFTFIVLSKIISGYTCYYAKTSEKNFFSRIFALPVFLIPTTLSGLFFSAPSGAVSVCDIYRKGLCTKQEAENAVTLCNNCSAAFIMSITASVLHSKRLALILLISNILTTLSVYFLVFRSKQVYTKKQYTKQASNKPGITSIICTSVKDSVFSTITLCGYILLFYTFSGIVQDKICALLHNCVSQSALTTLRALISSFFEMSSGILSCSLADTNTRIILCSVCTAFCGLSVLFQVTSVLNEAGLSSKKYILSKFLSALLCPVYMLLFLFLLPVKVISVSNPAFLNASSLSPKSASAIIIIFAIFTTATYILSYVDKSNKNNR